MHFILTENLFSSLYLMNYQVGGVTNYQVGTAEPLRQKESPNLTIVPSSFRPKSRSTGRGVEKNVNCLWKYQRIPLHSRKLTFWTWKSSRWTGKSSSIHLHFFGSMENFQGSSWKKVLPNQHFWGSKKVVSRQDGWNPSGQNCWWIFFRNPSSFTMKSFSPFFTSWILQNLRSFLLVSRIFFNISTNTTVSTVTYQNQKMIHGSFKLKLYMSPDFWDYFKRKGHEPSSNQPSIFR